MRMIMTKNLPAILKEYFSDFLNIHKENASDLHKTCMQEMELVLIQAIMNYTKGNQVQASKILGINRNTLRRKITEYCMDVEVFKAS